MSQIKARGNLSDKSDPRAVETERSIVESSHSNDPYPLSKHKAVTNLRKHR
jgi:hypothetical protein